MLKRYKKNAILTATILVSVGALMGVGLVLAQSDIGPKAGVQMKSGSATAQSRS